MNGLYKISIFLITLEICGAKNIFKNYKSEEKYQQKWELGKSPQIDFLHTKEYPMANADSIMKIKQQWEKHYRCLDKSYDKSRKDELSVEVFTHLVLEGKSLRMQCETCLSPAETAMEAVTWHLLNSYEEHHKSPRIGNDAFKDRVLQNPYDNTLTLLEARGGMNGDGGLYACYQSGSLRVVHFLHVALNDEPVVEVRPLTSPKGPYPKQIEKEGELIGFTEWTTWSPCTAPIDRTTGQCRKTGKHTRFGACKLTFTTNKLNDSQQNYEIQENNKINTNYVHTKNTSKETHFHSLNKSSKKFLQLFGDQGLPCRSLLLPNYMRTNLKARPNEMMTGFCKMDCTRFENTISLPNSKRQLYDTLDSMPPLLPTVKRMFVFGNTGSKVTLKCPSEQVEEPTAQWKVGKLTINSADIRMKSKGRFFIDIRNHLHIQSLQLQDTNIYSCWRYDHLVATIKLHVVKKFQFTFNHHLALIVLFLILATLASIFFKVMKSSIKRKRTNLKIMS